MVTISRDSSIAAEWLSHYKSQELTGKYATFEGRPVVGINKAYCLYHVMDSLVAAECWLFKTRSEGICRICHPLHPGHTHR